jgi:hypothetical protein
MLKVCLVKQHTTYDLYTKTGPDLRAMVASSNWRSGPIGLWEAFDCDFRIVYESSDRECQIGKRHWARYVQGWNIWPEGSVAEHVSKVDWGQYDIVISIDVAVPSRIVRNFHNVMWCYSFIEGGPTGIDHVFRGSPYFGYNVFLNHRLAKTRLTAESRPILDMDKQRRAVLDFPYYVQSSASMSKLYPELVDVKRDGLVLSHHSYACLSDSQRMILGKIGPVRFPKQSISDIHRCEMQSRFFVVHPESRPMAGLAIIEAISAGCLALAPQSKLWGFPELVAMCPNYSTFDELVQLLIWFDAHPEEYEELCREQARVVETQCFVNPTANLQALHATFRASRCSVGRQLLSEKQSAVKAKIERIALHVARRIRRVWGEA